MCKWCKVYERSEGTVLFKDRVCIVTKIDGKIYCIYRECMTPSPHDQGWMDLKIKVNARRTWNTDWYSKTNYSGHFYIEAYHVPAKKRKKNEKYPDAALSKPRVYEPEKA